MNSVRCLAIATLFCLLALFSLSHYSVAATRCQVSSPSYVVPSVAMPGQLIQTATSVSGSCTSNGEDYYSVRVDLVDANSGLILSDNSTPIGYNATHFTVTVENTATAPSTNGTWTLNIDVYVIRAGGTAGANLLDYKNSTSATIQVGGSMPTPEFPTTLSLTLAVGLWAPLALLQVRKHRRSYKHRN